MNDAISEFLQTLSTAHSRGMDRSCCEPGRSRRAGNATASLPEVLIVATSGTIALTGNYYGDPGGGALSRVSVGRLVRAAPGVDKVAALSGLHGIVVTHGTDTMEETAYCLDFAVPGDRAVFVARAMRPGTVVRRPNLRWRPQCPEGSRVVDARAVADR